MIEKFFIQEGIKKINLENYLKTELDRAGFCGMTISKTPLATRIIVDVTKPGLAIGKSGTTIMQLTNVISEKFKIENPQLEINEIKVPELNAKATLNRIIALIERGFSWKSVAFRSVEDSLKAGAIGIELVLKGKLTGKGGRKMKHRIAKGYMKKAGNLTNLVDFAKGTASTKAGAIGIKLRIIRPGTVFPDKISIKEIVEKAQARSEGAKDVVGSKPVEEKIEESKEEKKIDVESTEPKVEKKKVVSHEGKKPKKIEHKKTEHKPQEKKGSEKKAVDVQKKKEEAEDKSDKQ